MPKRASWLRPLGLVVAGACLAGLVPVEGATLAAPGFTLQLLDGGELSLALLQGSPVLLLFWAPW